jgi:hypothetical protein
MFRIYFHLGKNPVQKCQLRICNLFPALLVLYAILFFVYDDLAYVSCYFLFYVNDDHAMQCTSYTDKKENQIFLIYKEIQSGAVAKSYARKGFLIYEKMRKYFPYMRRP